MPQSSAQRLAVEFIYHVEQPKAASILQLVVHEVHGPDLVALLRHGQWLGLLTHQPLARLDKQVQLQLPVVALPPAHLPAGSLIETFCGHPAILPSAPDFV